MIRSMLKRFLNDKRLFCACVAIASICFSSTQVQAQFYQFKKNEIDLNVENRVTKDFYTEGVTKNGFIIHPQVGVETLYDSNVLAQDNSAKDDFSFSVRPSLDIFKEFRDHRFLLNIAGAIEKFISERGEDNETYQTRMKANIVGNSRWSFPISFSHEQGVRERTRPLVTQTSDERLNYNYTQADIGIKRQFNRLSITLLGNYASLSNEDGINLDRTAPVVFSDKDRSLYGGTLRFEYDFPRYDDSDYSEHVFFTNLSYANNEYDKRQFEGTGFTGPFADFSEIGFLSGFQTSYKGLVYADIGLGYSHQSYDDPTLKDGNTFRIAADIDYNISPKLTLSFDALRDVDPDNGLERGLVTSNYSIGADYELQHDLYAGAELGYSNYDFQEIDRSDDDYYGSIYLRHNHNRYLESMLRLRYQNRDSNFDQRDFDRFEAMLYLTGKI